MSDSEHSKQDTIVDAQETITELVRDLNKSFEKSVADLRRANEERRRTLLVAAEVYVDAMKAELDLLDLVDALMEIHVARPEYMSDGRKRNDVASRLANCAKKIVDNSALIDTLK